MKVPTWASASLSRELTRVVSKEESETLEFKQAIGKKTHRFQQSVAAMSTFGGGRILIGVKDDGSICGCAGSSEQRDDLILQVNQLIRGVNPIPATKVAWAAHETKAVLVVDIPKQERSVYYFDDRPYTRVGPSSLRATPEQVEDCFESHPSRAHKKRMEELTYKQAQGFVEDSRQQRQAAAEASAMQRGLNLSRANMPTRGRE